MRTRERTLLVDENIARRAERRLRPYGIDLNNYISSVLISVALVPATSSVRPSAWPEPTANARKCIKAAQDIESGKVAAKGYTDMDEMMKDLLA